jgi:hypothetical protein
MIYLAPLKTWVVNILKEREKDSKISNTKMPFIIMTSGIKVIKGKPQATKLETLKNVEQILQDKIQPEYYGCIISNKINPSLNYSQGATTIGYDFTGKIITVNEYGRKISQPIIESLAIDTDGTNNALKTTRINVRCFSLKQLEMFELFFGKAGTHILVEYGDNSNTSMLNSAMVNKSNYDKFVESFKSLTDPNVNQFAKYLNDCRIAKGSYDRATGKLTAFSYSIEQDGTYFVNIEISDSNVYNLALPKDFITKYSSFKTPNNIKPGFEQWKYKLLTELPGLKKELIEPLTEEKWGKHFYNWGKINKTKLDESTSSEPYLSLQFILEVLMNNQTAEGANAPEFTFKVPEFLVGDTNKKMIPISMHPNMISSNPVVIFPHENLPQFVVDEKSGEINISDKTIDGRINGISMIEPNKKEIYLQIPDESGPKEIQNIKVEAKADLIIGNALNIFIRYREIGLAWERNLLARDFLIDILNTINENSYELFRLKLGSLQENSRITVLDVLLTNKLKKELDDIRMPYRFKPTTINSNVRDFKFQFELTDQLAATTVFNASKFLAAKKYTDELKNKEGDDGLSLPKGVYQSIDYSSFSTADGYYAINQIEYEQITPLLQKKEKKQSIKTKEEIDRIKREIQKSYDSKTKKFKIKEGDIKTLVFTDKSFIVNIFKLNDNKVRNQYELLTPIKVNVTIDGISGITCGETFKVDGIPEQYNKLGSFQTTNVKHVINNQQGWTTEIEGEYRYAS